jgi:pyruvate dehydrogenase E1 component alpha subunit
MYRTMVQTRAFDTAALQLQRTGRLGTYASPLGQEAIGVGAASAMREEDLLVPSYREFSAQLWRGVSMTELLLFWGGDERGSDFQVPRHDFPVSIPVASHTCHATGAAYAFKLKRQPRVAVCFLGDGATSKGDFYESLNAAGAWRVPVVFVVSNNRWAISVPLQRQTAATTLAQKAIAAGVACEQVDGNDMLAVRAATEFAIEHARSGKGPQLIEALTYRISDHTTADDASRYRDPREVEAARGDDPISRVRTFLGSSELMTEAQDRSLREQVDREVQQAVDQYLAVSPMPPSAMFDHLFAVLPDSMADQRAAVEEDRG